MDTVLQDKLVTLQDTLDTDRMQQEFQNYSREIWGEQKQIHKVAVEVVRRRNQRCVMRYIIEMDGPAGGSVRTTLFGKVYKEARGRPVFQKMRDLWANGFAPNNGSMISMPKPYVFMDDLNLLIQEEIPGVPIKDLINSEADSENLRILARTLAKLHQTRIPLEHPFTIKDHLNRSHPKLSFLKLALPDMKDTVQQVIDYVFAWEKMTPIEPLVPIHGDFHAGQVHIEGPRSWMIDFDAMELSDPAADLGNMLVFLKAKRKLRKRDEFINAFLDEYFRHMDHKIAERIPVYEAITHLRRAAKRLRLQQEGWQKKAGKMIRTAAEIVGQA